MSDDVLFIAAGSAGALFGLWRIVSGRIPERDALGLLALIGAALLGGLVYDGVTSISAGGSFLDHRADTGAFVLLGIVMIMPLWGFFDERILARVSEVGVASIGLTTAYQLTDRTGSVVAVAVVFASIVLAFQLVRSNHRGLLRLFAYGWFLTGAVVLAIVEADGALDPLGSEITDVAAGPIFAAFAALLWLSFHGVFAAKFSLIAFTTHRRRGRYLALDFADRVVVRANTSVATSAALLGVEGSLLLSDHLTDWASNDVLVAIMIFAMPVAERLSART